MRDPFNPEPMNPIVARIRWWFRAILRTVVWSGVTILCMAALLVHWSFACSPKAYEGLHNTNGWIPLDSLSEEARNFASVQILELSDYYHCVKLARSRGRRYYEWPDPWNLASACLFNLTLDSDSIIELNLSRETSISPAKRTVEIETLFHAFPGINYYKHLSLKQMLQNGQITPPRYRELKQYLNKHFPNHIPLH